MAQKKPIAPTSHEETQQDKTTEGQRAINLLWEHTQAKIALVVVVITILANAAITLVLIIRQIDMTAGQAMGISFLNMICGIVISFYFSRTNHSAIGSIGKKATDDQPYKGR